MSYSSDLTIRVAYWAARATAPGRELGINTRRRTYRHEVLDAYVFESLDQVREITRQWIREYNEERLHDSLGRILPAMFRRQVENAENSSLELSH